MYIIAFFSENGVPRERLNATVMVKNLANSATAYVPRTAMEDVGEGIYRHEFHPSASTNHFVLCDGSNAMPDRERFTKAYISTDAKRKSIVS